MSIARTQALGEVIAVIVALDGASVPEINAVRGTGQSRATYIAINHLSSKNLIRVCRRKGQSFFWCLTQGGIEFWLDLLEWGMRRDEDARLRARRSKEKSLKNRDSSAKTMEHVMTTETEEKKHPDIALSPVESSQIHAIGHDAASNTLAVQFKGKSGPTSTYHYANFTAEDFRKFREAESIGAHFGKHIKHAEAHPFTKVS